GSSITVALRRGTYAIDPLTGGQLFIEAGGTKKEEAFVLTGYNGEDARLDGTCTSSSTMGCNSPEDPGRIWELLTLRGRWIAVSNLTFDNVHKYNISVQASNVCITG